MVEKTQTRREKKYGRVGLVGRFKPLHNGAAALLESACEFSEYVVIGIGSSNKYNLRNPFTPEETKGMIDSFLSGKYSNYEVIFVPDFAHIPEFRDGQKWREYVNENFGKLDYFVSGNDFVRNLLKEDYEIIHPGDFVPKERHVLLRATKVRYEIAKHGEWKNLVPEKVADYLESNGLIERFRKEFGLQTLAEISELSYDKDESALQEMLHAREK